MVSGRAAGLAVEVELLGSCLFCKLGNDDPQRTSRQRDEGFEVEQFERALGENRVPFGTGVDNILDVVSLLKASLRRFLLH
uniref:Uncharacterized protein n=1 Tax=Oryza glumipatula TaxID=40148 RepID=A0A0D9Y3Z9_9ORYZ